MQAAKTWFVCEFVGVICTIVNLRFSAPTFTCDTLERHLANLRAYGQTLGTWRSWTWGRSSRSKELQLNRLQQATLTSVVSKDVWERKKYSSNLSPLVQYIHQISFAFLFCQKPKLRDLYICEKKRSYTKAFGYKVASIFPNMHEGVWGLRTSQDHISVCEIICFFLNT